MILSSTNSIL